MLDLDLQTPYAPADPPSPCHVPPTYREAISERATAIYRDVPITDPHDDIDPQGDTSIPRAVRGADGVIQIPRV